MFMEKTIFLTTFRWLNMHLVKLTWEHHCCPLQLNITRGLKQQILFVFSFLLLYTITHHDDFNPLGHRIGFVVLFFSQHTGKVAQLPNWPALTIFPGELYTQTCMSTQGSFPHSIQDYTYITLTFLNVTYHPYLQNQGDTRREECHEDKVIGQYRHTAKATHDL